MANKKKAYDLCRSAVVWPNVENKHCVFVIQKGDSPWQGVRVTTLKQNVSFLSAIPTTVK